MDRRAFYSSAIAGTLLIVAGSWALGQSHDHATPRRQSTLATAAADCVLRGQECIDHCIGVVKAGDTSLADCMKSVEELVAACAALRVLTISNSKSLRGFAKAVEPICQACEAECRKPADKHAACKACGDSCTACIDAIRESFV